MTFPEFVRKVLGHELWPHQEEAAASTAFITTIAAARRTGKTTLIEWLSIWTAFRERDVVVVILSATQDSSRRCTESILQTLHGTDLTAGSVQDGHATRIRLTNGSVIVSLPASPKQVRGYGKGLKMIVFDEAGFQANQMWTAGKYAALDERRNGSRIVLAGTPWGGPELFFRQEFDAGMAGDPDHASFQWKHTANPLLDHDYLERQRERVSPAEFAAEVLGEWSDAAGSLFPRKLLDRQTADVELPAMRALGGPARPYIGLDWGVSFDRSAAAFVYRIPVGPLNDLPVAPRYVVCPYVFPQAEPLSDVVEAVASVPVRAEILSSETVGVGAGPSQMIGTRQAEVGRVPGKWNMVHTSNAIKTAAYGALLALLERNQLVLPRHPELLRQLAGLRFEQGERGFTRIGAEDAAVHDDVTDALALATAPYPVRAGRGGGRIAVALLAAASSNAFPDAPVRESLPSSLDDLVETGGGLLVWRRPPLQSITGPDLSYPPST